MTAFDPGTPIVSGDLLRDEDGAPLPHELQHGGAIWLAVRETLKMGGDATGIEDEIAEDILRALAPILWPLLPSNDHSETALVRRFLDRFNATAEDAPPRGTQLDPARVVWCVTHQQYSGRQCVGHRCVTRDDAIVAEIEEGDA